MKSINLFALGQFGLEDVGIFLTWLDRIPAGESSLENMKKAPPVRTSKLSPLLKVLEQLKLVQRKQDRFSITSAGEEFLQSTASARKAVIRAFFLTAVEVKVVVDSLNTSSTGRLPRNTVDEAFGSNALSSTTKTEIQTFLSWAQNSELFGYDKKKEEIFRLDVGTPQKPRQTEPAQSASLPRAS